jgi:hypothetical protein
MPINIQATISILNGSFSFRNLATTSIVDCNAP